MELGETAQVVSDGGDQDTVNALFVKGFDVCAFSCRVIVRGPEEYREPVLGGPAFGRPRQVGEEGVTDVEDDQPDTP